MKKVILSIHLIGTLFAFAQEKEVTAYISDAGNASKASAAKLAIENSANLISPEVLAEYYYTVAKANQANTDVVIENLSKLSEVEGKTYYSAKNKDTKTTEYYFDKAKAESMISSGNYSKMKTATASNKFGQLAAAEMQSLPQKTLNEANSAYNSKSFDIAGQKFVETYNILKAFGVDDAIYKYNGGLSYQLGKNNDKAIEVYTQLIDAGWTGAKTNYSAVIKGSTERIPIGSKEEFEEAKKNPLYTDFKEETEPSKEQNLYENLISIFSATKKYKEAQPYLEVAMKKFPQSELLNQLAGNIYYASGDTSKFLTQLKENIKANPNDGNSYYNLAVLLSQNENATDKELAEAKSYLIKASELEPTNPSPLQNLTSIILQPEKEYVEIINENLDHEIVKQKKTYDEYSKKRQALYKEALPYFKKLYELKPNDYFTANNLKKTYSVLEMFDKEDELQPIVQKLREERKNQN